VGEPELMDDAEQAAAYSGADFASSHQLFADETARRFPELRTRGGTMLDVGCGPADVTVRLARVCPGWSIVGIEGATEMVRLARRRIAEASLEHRVRVERVRLPSRQLLGRRFDAVVASSLLHHLADPRMLWQVVGAVLPPGAPVSVFDLRRPATAEELDALVARYAANEPQVLCVDFANSLRAAYRPDEVAAQLETAGLGGLRVEAVGDRHLLVSGRR
jgi:2-polyprenyl-3-methyl-5-hydroxy-6-metoxy-1,4-benzoquinol methylase